MAVQEKVRQQKVQRQSKKMIVIQGEIYLADLSGLIKDKQLTPVLVIQNNMGNRFSPCTIALTASGKNVNGDWLWDFEKMNTIDKTRLKSKLGAMADVDLKKLLSQLKQYLVG